MHMRHVSVADSHVRLAAAARSVAPGHPSSQPRAPRLAQRTTLSCLSLSRTIASRVHIQAVAVGPTVRCL